MTQSSLCPLYGLFGGPPAISRLPILELLAFLGLWLPLVCLRPCLLYHLTALDGPHKLVFCHPLPPTSPLYFPFPDLAHTYPKDGDSMFFCNNGSDLPDHIVS